METAKYILTLWALLCVNMVAANYLGWLATEWKRPLFNIKPFSCRPCLTFWITLCMGAPLIPIYGEAALAVAVVLICSAFLNFIFLNNKIQINE